jgi:hypothetical protein
VVRGGGRFDARRYIFMDSCGADEQIKYAQSIVWRRNLTHSLVHQDNDSLFILILSSIILRHVKLNTTKIDLLRSNLTSLVLR